MVHGEGKSSVLSYRYKSTQCKAKPPPTFCFAEAGFTRDLRPASEPSSPQADTVGLAAMYGH